MTKPQNLYIRRSVALTVFAAVIWLALCALFVFLAITFDRENLFDDLVDAVIFYVADGFICAVMLIYAVLNLLNLRRKFVIYTDEKGIYHFSGFIHLGFIPWEEVGEIICMRRISAVIRDGSPRLRIYPRYPDKFWQSLNYLKRLGLTFGGGIIRLNGAVYGGPCIKVRTLGTHVKPEALGAALLERRDYFAKQNNAAV